MSETIMAERIRYHFCTDYVVTAWNNCMPWRYQEIDEFPKVSKFSGRKIVTRRGTALSAAQKNFFIVIWARQSAKPK